MVTQKSMPIVIANSNRFFLSVSRLLPKSLYTDKLTDTKLPIKMNCVDHLQEVNFIDVFVCDVFVCQILVLFINFTKQYGRNRSF